MSPRWHKALIALALFLELAGLLLLLGAHAIWAFGSHSVASLCAMSLVTLLPEDYREPRLGGSLFFMALSFFIPAVGLIGSILLVLCAWRFRREEAIEDWATYDIPELPRQPRGAGKSGPIAYSEAGLAGVLRNLPDPTWRVSAVLSLKRLSSKQAIPLLRIALRDPSDEVRLLAYAILDEKDKELNAQITKELAMLERASAERRPPIHRALAQHYWEQVYLDLAVGDLRDRVLASSRTHAQAGLDGQDDVRTRFLLGRILMEEGKLDESREAFVRAQSLGLPDEVVRPYLAELAFSERKWDEVRVHLAALPPSALTRPPLRGVATYLLGGTA